MLLEHIFRVLDPDIDDADAELVANLSGNMHRPKR